MSRRFISALPALMSFWTKNGDAYLFVIFAIDTKDNCCNGEKYKIAVGTLIAERPPHRTGRARLRHPAPTFDVGGEAYGLPHAVQAVGRAVPAVRGVPSCSAISLAPALGSTNCSAGRPASFARFTATVAESDTSSPCIIGFGSSPSRCGPLTSRAAKVEVSRFPVEELTDMPGSSTTQDRKRARVDAPPFRLPLMTTASASQLILSRLSR